MKKNGWMKLGVCLFAASAQAATFTWNGGGADANWQTAANWSGGAAPVSDGTATLAFSGGTRTAAANNYPADTVFAAINFLNDRSSGKTANFTLSGNRITLGGNITTTVPTADGTLADTLSLPILLNGTRTVTVNTSSARIHNLTISGVISGGYGLIKAGAADLTLSGANTYTGPTTLNAGRTYYNSIKNIGGGASAFGAPTTPADGTIQTKATMIYNGSGSATTDRPIVILNTSMQFYNSTAGTTLTLNGDATAGFAFRGSGMIAVNGWIYNATGDTVSRTDNGTVYLNNPTNAFTGKLTVSDGIISTPFLANGGERCGIGAGSEILLGQNSPYTTTGTFQFTGPDGGACDRTLTIRSANSATHGGRLENTAAGQTLAWSGSVVADDGASKPAPLWLTGAGDGVFSGSVSPDIRLVKTGAGTWSLAGTDMPPAGIAVEGGTLLVTGSTAAATPVSVSAGGTLGGTGAIGGAVSVASGGILAPGTDGAGTLTLSDTGNALTLDGGTVAIPLSGSGAVPSLAVAGTLVLNGANTFELLLPDGSVPAGTYVLATYADLSGVGTLVLSRVYPNATLDVGPTSATLTVAGTGMTPNLVWQGDGAANLWDTTTANWLPGLFGDGMAVVFDDTGSDAPAVSVSPAGVSPVEVTVDSSAKNYTFGGGAVTTVGGLVKNGAGSLTLNNANVYGGTVALNGGALVINGALGSAGINVAAGTVLTQGVAAAVSGEGAGLTVSGAAALLGASTYTGPTTVNTAGSLVLGGVLDGSSITVATNAFFSQSAGSMIAGSDVSLTLRAASATLSGSNTYDGVTTLGVLGIPSLVYTVNHNHALGSTAGGTRMYGGNGATVSRLTLGRNIQVTGEQLILSGDNSFRAGLGYNQTSGTGTWAGAIACIGAAYIESIASGGTLAIGVDDSTAVTNAAACSLSMRGAGIIALNSRVTIGTGNSLLRNDTGTLLINAAGNIWGSTGFSEGTIRMNVADGLPVTTTLAVGKSDKKSLCVFDLNGHDQTVAAITDVHYAGPLDHSGTQRILSAAPATLTVSGSLVRSWGLEGSCIEGAVSLVQAGSGTLTLTGVNSYSGATVVSNGTLAVSAGGTLGTNGMEVVVGGTGTLRLSASDAIPDEAVVRMPPFRVDTAKIFLDADVEETVGWLLYDEAFKSVGTYGATGSGAQHIDDTHFSGSGKLRVLRSRSGLVLSIR